MAERSGSGRGKGRKNISLDENEKKAILDTVSQSDRPVAQMLRELGISRSTYYNWLSRYEEDGLEGLKDKRDSEKPSSGEEVAPPIPAAKEKRKGEAESGEGKPSAPEEMSGAAQPETARRPSPYSDTIAPEIRETPKWKAQESAVKISEAEEPETDTAKVPKSGTPPVDAEAESKKEEPKLTDKRVKPQPPKSPPGVSGGSKPRSTFFILLVIIAVIAGVVITISMYNASGYFFKIADGQVELWRGKFAPFGKTQVAGFKAMDLGSMDVSPVLDRRFYGEWEAVNALFSHILNEAEVSMDKADSSSFGSAGQFLGLAEELANGGEPGESPKRRNLAFKYRLLQKRIFHMEKSLASMYRDLTGVLSDLKAQNVPVHGNIEQMIKETNARAFELESWIAPDASGEAVRDTTVKEAPADEPAKPTESPAAEGASN